MNERMKGSVPTWFRIEQCLNCRVPGINPPQFYEKKRTTFAIQRTDFVVSPQVFFIQLEKYRRVKASRRKIRLRIIHSQRQNDKGSREIVN